MILDAWTIRKIRRENKFDKHGNELLPDTIYDGFPKVTDKLSADLTLHEIGLWTCHLHIVGARARLRIRQGNDHRHADNFKRRIR